ncbi:MAG TPA: hypothetical protein VKA88_08280 [Solirubrobacterales bacterium]|nr:hypothetical protein [Solirubrobacterales bacterium]
MLGNESLRRLGALIATDGLGHIRGVLTIDAIGKALRPSGHQAAASGGDGL